MPVSGGKNYTLKLFMTNIDQTKSLVEAIIYRMKKTIGVKTDVDLADYFGGTRSGPAVWKIRGRIPVAECIRLAEEKGVSLDWLIMGRGEPDISDERIGAAAVIAQEVCDLPCFHMETYPNPQKPPMWFSVPKDWMRESGLSEENTFVVRAYGDGMAPTICDGEPVVINRNRRELDGVFLVRFGNQLRFKRMQHLVDGTVLLKNDNEQYRDEVVKDESSYEVIGFAHSTFGKLV